MQISINQYVDDIIAGFEMRDMPRYILDDF